MAPRYSRWRGVPARASPWSAAARPAPSSAGAGGVHSGCSSAIACPQYPIAHVESAVTASLNASPAFSYQKECSSATPRSNLRCASVLHDTGKRRRPRCSACCSCPSCAARPLVATSAKVKANGDLIVCLRDLARHQCAMLTAGCQSVSLPSPPTRGLMRPMHDLLQLGLIALAAAASACVQRADVATEERVIRDLDKKWVQAVAAKDTTAIANGYAEDANLLAAGAPRASGRAAIRQAWVGFLKTPKLVLTFEPTKITIASSADIAYESGSYHLGDDVATKAKRVKGEAVKSRRVADTGKYVVACEQGNGEGKVPDDIFNSDKQGV